MAFSYATEESYTKNRQTGRGGKRKPDCEGMSCKRFVQTMAAGGCPESEIARVTMAVWKSFHPSMRWAQKIGKKWESSSETLSKMTIESAIWFGNGVRSLKDNGDPLVNAYLAGKIDKLGIRRIKLPAKVADVVDKALPGFLDVHRGK